MVCFGVWAPFLYMFTGQLETPELPPVRDSIFLQPTDANQRSN